MARKFERLDVMRMFSTLTLEHWKDILVSAVRDGRVEKLVSWRYGLQSGLADANAKGVITSQKVDLWVIKRCKDLEKAMRMILKKKYPSPMDNPKYDRLSYAHKVIDVKRRRDREFEDFLRKSGF